MSDIPRPDFWQWLRLKIAGAIPLDAPVLLTLIRLVLRRSVMQEINLIKAAEPSQPINLEPPPPHNTRSDNGIYMDLNNPAAGASFTPFGRNMPRGDRDVDRSPPVQTIAHKLLARDTFKPAGDQLNVLAAAWIQFMAHDWMRGEQLDDLVELSEGSGCPLNNFSFKKSAVRESDGALINEKTHWWDTGVIYGATGAEVSKVRTLVGGRLRVTNDLGVLPSDEDGVVVSGDNQNVWVGVRLLQDLFVREHNLVADTIAREHPELADDDEALFRRARLVVAAVAAKIHTVDWTVELLKTPSLKAGMETNWYGLFHGLGLTNGGPPGVFSVVGKTTENHGVPFALTDEFLSVYRLHPMIPDVLPLESGEQRIENFFTQAGDDLLRENPSVALEAWDAIIKYPCGNLELFNYPSDMRNLDHSDTDGKSMESNIDLAALDLYRDRERGLKKYNDFRRGLYLEPFKDYADLTGGNQKAIAALTDVYGPDGIEEVDLLVGNLAEKKVAGFAISETSFEVFLLMASRRLETDRFLNEDFTEEVYSQAGLKWVQETDGIKQVIARHLPDQYKLIPANESGFKPTTVWPQ